MHTPFVISQPGAKPRFFTSLGMKMLSVAALLLVFSLGLCSVSLLALTRRMLQDNLETKVSQDSQFFSSISQGLLPNINSASKNRLTQLAKELLREPEIVAISVLDAHKHVIVQVSRPVRAAYAPLTLQLPIIANHHPVGWIRAWYSPGLALEEFWRMAKDWVIVLLCCTLVVFVMVFLAVNEWILARPFRQLLAAIDAVDAGDVLAPIDVPQHSDEWGQLASRLNRFLGHVMDMQEQSKVLHETSRLLGLPWELKGALEGILATILHRYNLSSCLVFSPVSAHAPAAAPSPASGVAIAETDPDELRVQYASGISEPLAEKLSLRLGQGAGGVAYASAARRMIPDLNVGGTNDPLLKELAQRQQIRSALFIPMEGNGHAAGVVAYFSRSPNNFPDAAANSLALFTQQLALAVHNARMLSQLQDFNKGLEWEVATTFGELNKTNERLVKKVRELKTIYDLALATAASTNVEEIVRVIIHAVKELVDVSAAAFFLYDKASGLLEPLQPAFDPPSNPAQTLACKLEESKFLERVIREGKPQTLNFVEPSEQLPTSWDDLAIRSILALPLRQGDQTVVRR